MEYLKEENDRARKILFTGLDTAGKTSIILTLKKEFSKIAVISPTKGAQRRIFDFLDIEISEWDLGGQETYRISYLKNPNMYFDNTEIAIFVIDIQNEERIPEAISYLKDVIDQFYTLKINPPINIFFHKYDPDFPKDIKENWDELISKLKQKIYDETYYSKLSFYITSIYNLNSIIFTVSEILLKLYPKTQLIKKTISEFCNKINCSGMLILDQNSLIIGSSYKEKESQELIKQIMPYFIKFNKKIQKDNNLGGDVKDQLIFQRSKYYFLFKRISLGNTHSPLYLILLKKGYYFFKEEVFEPLINMLKPIISKQALSKPYAF
ncbi:MAG: ADP-ribosylation factor-like protein [Candidatus Odinarchaeota archaeon]